MRLTAGFTARVFGSVGVLVGVLAFSVPPAEASCALPLPIPRAVSQAAAAFIGTVTATDWQGRRATVTVEDVWRGTVSTAALVTGTPGGAAERTTVDRRYIVGERYLFVPWARRTSSWQDNACSSTRVFDASIAKLRPAGAVRISSSVTSPSPSVAIGEATASVSSRASGRRDAAFSRRNGWLAAAALGVAGAAWAVVWRRRRHRPARTRESLAPPANARCAAHVGRSGLCATVCATGIGSGPSGPVR